jgi:hypothetical protein
LHCALFTATTFTIHTLQIRTLFPKYVVDLATNEIGEPAAIDVVYTNGKKQHIDAHSKSVFDIFDEMLEYTAEIEEKEELAEMDKN